MDFVIRFLVLPEQGIVTVRVFIIVLQYFIFSSLGEVLLHFIDDVVPEVLW